MGEVSSEELAAMTYQGLMASQRAHPVDSYVTLVGAKGTGRVVLSVTPATPRPGLPMPCAWSMSSDRYEGATHGRLLLAMIRRSRSAASGGHRVN